MQNIKLKWMKVDSVMENMWSKGHGNLEKPQVASFILFIYWKKTTVTLSGVKLGLKNEI